MKSLVWTGAIVLLGCLGGLPAAAHDCGHWGYDGDHCWYSGHHWRSVRPPAGVSSTATQTLAGKVSEIIYLPGATADSGMVEIRLQADGQARLVRLAPVGFLKQSGLSLREGDAITVQAYVVSAMEGDLLVATEIQQGNRRLSLRDTRGRPAW